ncbi:hypothetical protein [Kibdelosporangium phytohabitans]|nr:hypothetical protein [Kibdelosporangium phytohabitans]MBE1465126.1 hypothetical protein [Kibdelosporangium phytohabitans]
MRTLVLRAIWPDMIDGWAEPGALEATPAAARLLEAGADRDDLIRLARNAAYDTAFQLLYRLTAYGRDEDAPADSPGWCLVECTPGFELTEREIGSLHEDLLSLDPSGREGEDLFT